MRALFQQLLSVKRIVILIMGLSMGLLMTGPVISAEVVRGQLLYENHCQVCHEEWVHDGDRSKVTSLNEVRRRVAAWSQHSGLDWSDEEIADVADYLNRMFYKFAE